jgi:hypothetical protein
MGSKRLVSEKPNPVNLPTDQLSRRQRLSPLANRSLVYNNELVRFSVLPVVLVTLVSLFWNAGEPLLAGQEHY